MNFRHLLGCDTIEVVKIPSLSDQKAYVVFQIEQLQSDQAQKVKLCFYSNYSFDK